MADKLIYSSGATTNNAYGALTTSFAAFASGTFATANETGFGTFSTTTGQWTAPASSLPDAVLCLFNAEGEDSSNGRAVLQMRLANISGAGDLCSSEPGGYNRDNSEDRALVSGWAIIDSPGASSVWQIQGRRPVDAPGTGDELISGTVQFVPIYYSAIGLYSSSTSQNLTGTSYSRITGWTADVESDTAAIELGATTANVVDCKGASKRYLVLGGFTTVMAGTTRSQRVSQLRRDGVASAQGVTYLRQANSSPNGTAMYDLFETVTADIGVDMAACRGIGVGARQGGANVDGGSLSSMVMRMAIIELNDDAEVIRTHDSTGQQECALTGPVDLNIARDTDFNDSASFTVASNTAINAEQAMDAAVFSNINIPRNTNAIGSGSRWTAKSHVTVNGVEQVRAKCGDYSRGNQGTSDTMGWSGHSAAVLSLSANDDLGASVTELAGSEGGNGDIETEPFANNEGLSFIAINLDSLEAAAGESASGTPSLTAIESSGAATVIKKANGAVTVAAIIAAGTAAFTHDAAGTPSITPIEASGAATVVNTASGAASIATTEAASTALVRRQANGAPAITAIESAGTADVTGVTTASGNPSLTAAVAAGLATAHKSANGAATLTPIEVAGTSIVANIANGAVSIPSIEASGTALIIKTASGSPSLSAIEANGAASATGFTTASGNPSITEIEASGTAEIIRNASGNPSLTAIDAAGIAKVPLLANGAGSIPVIVASGTARLFVDASDGNPSIAALSAAGIATIVRNANGSASISAIEASGTATAGIKNSSGAALITPIESIGTAIVHRLANGAPALSAIESSGTALIISKANGSASLSAIEAAGIGLVHRIGSGVASITAIEASGICIVGGTPVFHTTEMAGYVIDNQFIGYHCYVTDMIAYALNEE